MPEPTDPCLSCNHPESAHTGPHCRHEHSYEGNTFLCPCAGFEPLSACKHDSLSGGWADGDWCCDQCGQVVDYA